MPEHAPDDTEVGSSEEIAPLASLRDTILRNRG